MYVNMQEILVMNIYLGLLADITLTPGEPRSDWVKVTRSGVGCQLT